MVEAHPVEEVRLAVARERVKARQCLVEIALRLVRVALSFERFGPQGVVRGNRLEKVVQRLERIVRSAEAQLGFADRQLCGDRGPAAWVFLPHLGELLEQGLVLFLLRGEQRRLGLGIGRRCGLGANGTFRHLERSGQRLRSVAFAAIGEVAGHRHASPGEEERQHRHQHQPLLVLQPVSRLESSLLEGVGAAQLFASHFFRHFRLLAPARRRNVRSAQARCQSRRRTALPARFFGLSRNISRIGTLSENLRRSWLTMYRLYRSGINSGKLQVRAKVGGAVPTWAT